MKELDHLLWGAPDLVRDCRAFATATGVSPAGGGSHSGFGTRNNLVSLGAGVYFEVISPDPEQSQHGRRAQRLLRLPTPRMHTFAVRGSDIDGYRDAALKLGLRTSDALPMSRTRSDGVTLHWRVVYIEDEAWGDFIPFMIDWQDSEHPSATAPVGCELKEFRVLHPEAERLTETYKTLGIPASVTRAPVPGFLVRLRTPKGEVVLT